MAGDINARFIFKLCVTVIATSWNNNRVRNGITAVAQILVEPRWDVNASQCFVDTNTTGGINFQGSAMETCSLQVLVPRGTHIQLQIPGRNKTQESAFVYVKRDGDLENCLHRFVVLNGKIESCISIFIHNNIQVIMQGNISLYIGDVPVMETLPVCPEEAIQDNERVPSYCSDVEGYNEIISCDPQISFECRINFPPNCGTILGHSEVIYQICNHDVYESYKALITYPIQTAVLDLSMNTIVKIDDHAFHCLQNIQKLYLRKNDLTTLGTGALWGLINLEVLDIASNQIAGLDVESFLHLRDLRYLTISNNILNTLPMHIFQNLFNLESLYLDGNQIKHLSAEIFVGLSKLKTLNLQNNLLNTLPKEIFQDLLNLEVLNLLGNQITNLSAEVFVGLSKLKTLNLQNNLLSILSKEIFHDLLNLEILKLLGNQITNLSEDVFVGLSSLRNLFLNNNLLSTFPNEIFHDLLNLETLNLDQNEIRNLIAGIFVGFSKLKHLYLHYNLLSTLPNGIFQDLLSLEILSLLKNQITKLSADVFVGLRNLKQLRLRNNVISTLPNGIFQDLLNLEVLHLRWNQITYLSADSFVGLSNLIYLWLDYNMLSISPNGNIQDLNIFKGLQKLKVLTMAYNQLDTLPSGLFHNTVSLELLSLSRNGLMDLPNDILKGLINLNFLSVSNNQLTHLSINVFNGLTNLFYLSLANNTLTQLDYDVFKDIINLAVLDLSDNRLNAIPNIEHLSYLQILDLTNNTLFMMHSTSLLSLSSNSNLFASQYEVCECYVPKQVNCSAADDRSPYLTCDRLLSDRALVVVMWLIGLGAVTGNMFVLIWRKKGTSTNVVNSILLQNLAASDLLMGIYMVIIASADIYFGDNFPMQSESWRSSIICRTAGALSIISSEASVLFVTLISIDRFIAIRFPYSIRRLRKYSVRIVAVMTWTVSFVLGIVPSVLSGSSFEFYDNSHVCIGLPLTLTKIYETERSTTRIHFEVAATTDKDIFTTKYTSLDHGLFFSTTIFLGLNCACYLIILGCYIEIIRAVLKSSKLSGRSQEIKEQIRLTTKVSAIVATDFFCWFPIIVLGILVQARVIELPPSVFAWCVTFVLPINSAINPYLYTIADVVSKYRKGKQDKTLDANKPKPVTTIKSRSTDITKTQNTPESGISDHQHDQDETDTYL